MQRTAVCLREIKELFSFRQSGQSAGRMAANNAPVFFHPPTRLGPLSLLGVQVAQQIQHPTGKGMAVAQQRSMHGQYPFALPLGFVKFTLVDE